MSNEIATQARELEEAAIRDGHRRLLQTYRECSENLAVTGRNPDIEEVRALIAFLRESVLTFARWEEGLLAPGTTVAEDTAFEHAFLQVETEALAAATAAQERAPADPDAWAESVRRQCHRIDAILELHVLKAEDRALSTAVPIVETLPTPAAASAADPEKRSGARNLSPWEVGAFLRGQSWGILATIGDEMPYAVPVSYGWNGSSVFLACAPGRKTRYLETAPVACLTVAEVQDGDHWRSAMVRGPIHWVTGTAGRLEALRVLHRQRGAESPSLRDLARLAVARFARIDPAEITGRSRG